MHRSCIHCVSLRIMRSRKLLQELKEIERHRILLTHFLLRPHILKMSASSLSIKMWTFEMSSSSCGLVTAVFVVSLPFGECKKKQCVSDTWKIIALHEGFHLSPFVLLIAVLLRWKMGIEQWWNDADIEKPRCSEKNPCELTKGPTMVFAVRSRHPTSWAVAWPEDWN